MTPRGAHAPPQVRPSARLPGVDKIASASDLLLEGLLIGARGQESFATGPSTNTSIQLKRNFSAQGYENFSTRKELACGSDYLGHLAALLNLN